MVGMSGESQVAERLVAQALAAAAEDPKQDAAAMGRALIVAVLEAQLRDRPLTDVVDEVQFLLDNLDGDDLVVTRGC